MDEPSILLPDEDVLPETLTTEMFDDLSVSDSSEFLDADEESSLRQRLFPPLLESGLINRSLVITLRIYKFIQVLVIVTNI